MNHSEKTYSIFCDESCHLQFDNSNVMCVGAVIIPDECLEICKNKIKHIKNKYGIYHELKWNTVSRTHLAMYDELIRFFFDTPMVFRSILIKNKSNIQANSLERDEYNQFYYSVIERLIRFSIRHTSDRANSYRVYLDLKDNHGKIKLVTIHKELTAMIGTDYIIKSMQNIRSHESQFIQLADI